MGEGRVASNETLHKGDLRKKIKMRPIHRKEMEVRSSSYPELFTMP